MIAVVADTNTILSAFLWNGLPFRLILLAQSQQVKLLTTQPLLDELEDVISRKKFEKRFAKIQLNPQIVFETYKAVAYAVEPVVIPENAVRDDDDRAVLACAVGGKANYIATGDKDLLTLKTYEDIPILTVREFLDLLEAPSDT